jgi:nitrous oxidase accessory protein NosD
MADVMRVQVGGSCKGALPVFSTIQAAVNAVPDDGTVFVCPGTYPEQLVISRRLTLQGVNTATGNNPTITVPVGGLTQLNPYIYLMPFITVNYAEKVTIKDLGIQGPGPGGPTAGIYLEGADATISGMLFWNLGSAALLYNDTSTPRSILFQNNEVHDAGSGVVSSGAGMEVLTLDVKNNWLDVTGYGVSYYGVTGSITNNTIFSQQYGITIDSPKTTVSSNAVRAGIVGVYIGGYIERLASDTLLSSNQISGGSAGVINFDRTATIQGNMILDSPTAIDLECTSSPTLKGNSIHDATYGIDGVPAGMPVGANTFFNVTTMQHGCR